MRVTGDTCKVFKGKSSSFYLVGVQYDFGLVRLKACHYAVTQVDDDFEAKGMFVSVHGIVSLMF